ncbi:MAG: hypothetical protein ABEJ66_00825, partial [Candidatus Nanohaloarchaea archaeon]
AAMIMGLGIDFGIHVTKKYYNSERGKEGLSVSMVELSRGLLGASMVCTRSASSSQQGFSPRTSAPWLCCRQ